MKLINDKGKLFGLINIMDLLVLLVLVGAAAGLFLYFTAPAETVSTDTITIVYTVRVRGVLDRIKVLVEEGLGKSTQLSTQDAPLDDARVLSCSFESYVQQKTTDDGRLLEIETPGRWDALFELEVTIPKPSIDESVMVGTQYIRVGSGHTVRTPHFELTGIIEKLDFGEDAA